MPGKASISLAKGVYTLRVETLEAFVIIRFLLNENLSFFIYCVPALVRMLVSFCLSVFYFRLGAVTISWLAFLLR
jgi:hypothetical protein